MTAGFEEPDEESILLRGADVVGVPPNKREVNMCFQHYALFPHMNVERNVEYGLSLKKVPKGDRAAIVAEMSYRRARRTAAAQARPALGRTAAARRARPSAREPAGGAAPR